MVEKAERVQQLATFLESVLEADGLTPASFLDKMPKKSNYELLMVCDIQDTVRMLQEYAAILQHREARYEN
jgi:hypothetical protein